MPDWERVSDKNLSVGSPAGGPADTASHSRENPGPFVRRHEPSAMSTPTKLVLGTVGVAGLLSVVILVNLVAA